MQIVLSGFRFGLAGWSWSGFGDCVLFGDFAVLC